MTDTTQPGKAAHTAQPHDHSPSFDPTSARLHGHAQIRTALGTDTSVEWTWPDD